MIIILHPTFTTLCACRESTGRVRRTTHLRAPQLPSPGRRSPSGGYNNNKRRPGLESRLRVRTHPFSAHVEPQDYIEWRALCSCLQVQEKCFMKHEPITKYIFFAPQTEVITHLIFFFLMFLCACQVERRTFEKTAAKFGQHSHRLWTGIQAIFLPF